MGFEGVDEALEDVGFVDEAFVGDGTFGVDGAFG